MLWEYCSGALYASIGCTHIVLVLSRDTASHVLILCGYCLASTQVLYLYCASIRPPMPTSCCPSSSSLRSAHSSGTTSRVPSAPRSPHRTSSATRSYASAADASAAEPASAIPRPHLIEADVAPASLQLHRHHGSGRKPQVPVHASRRRARLPHVSDRQRRSRCRRHHREGPFQQLRRANLCAQYLRLRRRRAE